MKKIIMVCVLAVSILCTGNISYSSESEEINYLLTHLENSGCTFIRNGDDHDAKEAREHLEMKYNYAKRRIKTAENFIDKIASKSSFSRKIYEVHCGNEITPSGQWLYKALADHREIKARLENNQLKKD